MKVTELEREPTGEAAILQTGDSVKHHFYTISFLNKHRAVRWVA